MGDLLLKLTVILLSLVNASVWWFYTGSKIMAVVWLIVVVAFAYWIADDVQRKGLGG
jgi:hypothetical protein